VARSEEAVPRMRAATMAILDLLDMVLSPAVC
jgi:hypothetical protein